jgi:hypothetical protein
MLMNIHNEPVQGHVADEQWNAMKPLNVYDCNRRMAG